MGRSRPPRLPPLVCCATQREWTRLSRLVGERLAHERFVRLPWRLRRRRTVPQAVSNENQGPSGSQAIAHRSPFTIFARFGQRHSADLRRGSGRVLARVSTRDGPAAPYLRQVQSGHRTKWRAARSHPDLCPGYRWWNIRHATIRERWRSPALCLAPEPRCRRPCRTADAYRSISPHCSVLG